MTKPKDSDCLIPARKVRKRFGDISGMTLWRWRQNGLLPEPVQINGRNFWFESTIDAIVEKAAGGAQ